MDSGEVEHSKGERNFAQRFSIDMSLQCWDDLDDRQTEPGWLVLVQEGSRQPGAHSENLKCRHGLVSLAAV